MGKIQKGRNLADYIPNYGEDKLPQRSKFVEARVNGGMITMLDPADIPPGALQVARNCRVRFDRTSRRAGHILLTPSKPNTNPVNGIFYIKKNNGDDFFLRFTPSTLHERGAGSWTDYSAGTGGSLTGGATDFIRAVVAFDRLFFTNNGVDVIQEADTTAQEYLALGNAEEYKYITAFFNRIVAANRGGATPNPAQVAWSGEFGSTGGLEEWDPLVEETAGFSPLVDSPSDLSDFLTGIFGFANVMVILREKSIWLATKQPIASNPFNFYSAFPGVGCDAPQSAKIVLNGLAWVDTRTGTVWFYEPGTQPNPIGRPIEATILNNLDDSSQVFASYSPKPNEYEVCIPQVGSDGVRTYTFNFRTQTWVQDEKEGISFSNDIDLTAGFVSIDELIGTIDNLTGTIDELSPTGDVIPVRLYGRSDGEIIQETPDPNVDTDPIFGGSTGEYETELLSKSFTVPEDDIYIVELKIELLPLSSGTLTLKYSKDGGETIHTSSKTKIPTAEELGKPILFRWVKQIKTRRFAWQLTAMRGQFDVIGYEVFVNRAGRATE